MSLWRTRFFEKAVFYGGSSLRILFGLDRFSEDLDFSLLSKNIDFSISNYHKGIIREFESLGFDISLEEKKKTIESAVKSAFKFTIDTCVCRACCCIFSVYFLLNNTIKSAHII